MALSAGTRLGPYEILGPLGAGGMGEVYRARDTRLDRAVAIKVLPSELADSPKRRERLEREARAISQLNHPHICTLHDVGREGEIDFLVMEHLEGESLADRLKKAPLPLEQVLRYAAEIAEALHTAHAHGIVHRDLKPGNVMLTKSGAKLLDFGLAKLRDPDSGDSPEALSALPTAAPLTDEGAIPGTYPYMAPEQLEEKEADARTDLFALGAVIYEMTTGRRAFAGDSRASLIASIQRDEVPSLVSGEAATPEALNRLAQQCLKKDPAERYQSAHDVAMRLREIAETGPEGQGSTTAAAPRWVPPLLVATLLVGALAGWLARRPSASTAEARVMRAEIDLTTDRSLIGSGRHPARTELAVSPDGRLLAWSGGVDDGNAGSALHVRRLDTGVVTRLPGTEYASQPVFSPDGRWIAFNGPGEGGVSLRKIPIDGGLVVELARLASSPMGLSWGANGRIYIGSTHQGIRWVPAEGGQATELTTVDSTLEAGHRLPSILPGGEVLLFTSMPTPWGVKSQVEAVALDSGERTVVVEDGADGRYLPTGHLVFVRQGVLMAAPFDIARLELAAAPVPVIEGLSQALNMGAGGENSGAGQYTVSDSGLLVYAPGTVQKDEPADLVVVDEAGRVELLPGFDRPLTTAQFAFSPDGRHLAFAEKAISGLLWLFDVERQTYRALSDSGIAGSPRWSPDGSRLAVSWSEGGQSQLWIVPLEGGEWTRLTDGESYATAPSWSPDGRFLAFVRGATSVDVFLYDFEDRKIAPFLASQAHEGYPAFSPNGRWLAYTSTESGRREVYVTSFPRRQQTVTVSRQGGRAPVWSRDGRRLFYYSASSDGTSSMVAVAVQSGDELRLGQPERLFRLPDELYTQGPMHFYDLHPDGQRFVIGVQTEVEPPPPITRLHLVQNWFEELNRLVPIER